MSQNINGGTTPPVIRPKRLMSVSEFSQTYNRSRSRTYELIRSGALVAVKDGRSTLIPVDAAEAWAARLNLSRKTYSVLSDKRGKP
jgi:excisionase family DNA binding protein